MRLSVTSRVHQRAPRRSGLRVGDKPRRARTGVNVRSELSGLRLLPHGPTRRTDRSLAASDDRGGSRLSWWQKSCQLSTDLNISGAACHPALRGP